MNLLSVDLKAVLKATMTAIAMARGCPRQGYSISRSLQGGCLRTGVGHPLQEPSKAPSAAKKGGRLTELPIRSDEFRDYQTDTPVG